MAVTLLKDAHEIVGRLMPAPDAEPEVLRDFYLRSAQVYDRVAEVDRGHHHEALYWAKRERSKGERIARVLEMGTAGGGSDE
ncbi:AMED_5909 family protein [Saccharothrix sp. Mg75]|uniref:AMED_5909 family protein n=1 Tax=Saccharothrix sp. Mg75 TaxID=3445357 RepID=UPI003EEC69FC